MADAAVTPVTEVRRARPKPRSRLRKFFERKSTIAFFMALPLILLIFTLVIYPAFYAIYLTTLNKRMTATAFMRNCTYLPDWICTNIPFGNLQFLLTRETFWMVFWQSGPGLPAGAYPITL